MLFRKASFPFGKQDTSHHRRLSLAGYSSSPMIPEHACPFHILMGTALVCETRTPTLTSRMRCSSCRSYPAGCPAPLSRYRDGGTSHRCITHFWLDNAQRLAVYGFALTGGSCQPTFQYLTIPYSAIPLYLVFKVPRVGIEPTASALRVQYQRQLDSGACAYFVEAPSDVFLCCNFYYRCTSGAIASGNKQPLWGD